MWPGEGVVLWKVWTKGVCGPEVLVLEWVFVSTNIRLIVPSGARKGSVMTGCEVWWEWGQALMKVLVLKESGSGGPHCWGMWSEKRSFSEPCCSVSLLSV